MATFRTTGEVKSLPKRNTWGQFQYRVAVDKEFAEAINKVWGAATQATPKQCLNTTAPAWLNEEAGVWTVTVGTGKAGMYPAGVSYGKACNVSFRIGADKYTQIIASATEEVAEKNAIIAVEKMEIVREAISEREFEEKITGIDSKLRSMAALASELGIPLGDLMKAEQAIASENAKKTAAKKGSQLGTQKFVSSGTKKEDNAKPEKKEDNAKPETETPTVILTEKIIAKWEALDYDELSSAMETYADTVGVELADVEVAYELATADND